ncbi:MAG TPA: carboxypeptidase regulatory-like domain-containing protein [Vicinamibacterales bacterium]|jgi:hypothetical protein
MNGTFERSCRSILLAIALTGCCVARAGLAFAGQGQEASIIGQVMDESGAVLPGVTVTATSPALQVPQVTNVSNDRGEYRLSPLPIGTYVVEYALQGFQIVRRENLRLTSGFTAKIDVQLKLGVQTETVTVSGAAPVVDATTATVRTLLTRETLELIPTSRNGLQALMEQAPGVRTNLDFGGAPPTTPNPTFRAFGRDNDSWTLVEGVVTTSPNTRNNSSGNYFDYAVIEETAVQTVANEASSPTQGINLSLIVKSGGNDFHGSGFSSATGPRFQSNNISDRLRTQGVTAGNPLSKRWDLNGDVGGRIVRDKIWFYYGARARAEDQVVAGAFKHDGSPQQNKSTSAYSTEKISYQVNPAIKLIGFHQRFYRDSEEEITAFTDFDSRQKKLYRVDTFKIESQIVSGNRFVSLQYGSWSWDLCRAPCAGKNARAYSDQIGTFDQLTSLVTGLNDEAATLTYGSRRHLRGAVNWYKPGLFAGNHDFKTGVDYLPRNNFDRAAFDRGVAENYRLIFRGGVPFDIDVKNNPVDPKTRYTSLGTYVQDSWTIERRLTLSLGGRFAYDDGHIPRQCRTAARAPFDVVFGAGCFGRVQFRKRHTLVPRLYAAYDLTGHAKTVIKGGWGRFAQERGIDELSAANADVALTAPFVWRDLNGNKRWEPGESNLNPNGPDFIGTTVQFGGSTSYAVPNPRERTPMSDQFSLSIEREIIANFAVRGTGIYSRSFDQYRVQNNRRPYEVYNIPVRNPDPGPDGRAGTADDPGTVITYYDYPAAYAGVAFQQPMLVNDPSADEHYRSFEMAATKRFSNRWQLMASYSATKLGLRQAPVADLNPNTEINTADHSWEWLTRISGSYRLPADVQLAANFENRSGSALARTVSVRGGQQVPSLTVRVEPIGSIRLPSLNNLHVRAEKSLRLQGVQRISLRLNVYNLLNVNTVLGATVLSGPNFMRPTSIALPRIVEFGALYTF